MNMTKKQIATIWYDNQLSCRNSYKPEYIEKMCKLFKVKWDKKLIYTKLGYRELANEVPRVDAEEFLQLIVKTHDLEPDKDLMALSNRMFGEGSRRDALERAYLEELEK